LITYKQYILTNIHIKNLTERTIVEVVLFIYVGLTEWQGLSTVVEQPFVQPTTEWPSSVPPGVKDVFVWLTETTAPW